jgi:hypothetical protein
MGTKSAQAEKLLVAPSTPMQLRGAAPGALMPQLRADARRSRQNLAICEVNILHAVRTP